MQRLAEVKQLSEERDLGLHLRREIVGLDPENMTPFDALQKLRELVEKARGNS